MAKKNLIDLHGCFPTEACLILLACIHAKWYQSFTHILLITGAGKHNRFGRSFALKEHVQQFFVAQGYRIQEEKTQTGTLKLDLSFGKTQP